MAKPGAFDPSSILERLRSGKQTEIEENSVPYPEVQHQSFIEEPRHHLETSTPQPAHAPMVAPAPPAPPAPTPRDAERRIQELQQALENSQTQNRQLRSEFQRLHLEFSNRAQADEQEIQRLRSCVVELEAALREVTEQPTEAFPDGILFRSEQPGADEAPPVLEWKDISQTPPIPPQPMGPRSKDAPRRQERHEQDRAGRRSQAATASLSIDLTARGGDATKTGLRREPGSSGRHGSSRLLEPTFSAEQRVRTKGELDSGGQELEEILRKPSRKSATELQGGKPAFASGAAPPGATSHRFGAGARKLKAPVRIPESIVAAAGSTGMRALSSKQPEIYVDFSKELL